MKKIRKFLSLNAVCLGFAFGALGVVSKPVLAQQVNTQLSEQQNSNYRFHLEKALRQDVEDGEMSFGQEKEADELFNAINAYCEQNSGVDASSFDEHNKKFLADSGSLKVVGREEFEEYFKNKPKAVRLFRGIVEPRFAEEFRNGKVFIGGTVKGPFSNGRYGSAFGSAIYTVANYDDAKYYAKGHKNNDALKASWRMCGSVVEMAFDEEQAKIIPIKRLKQIKYTMLQRHPEFCNLGYLYSRLIEPDYYYSNYWPQINECFKNRFGYDLTQIPENFEKFVNDVNFKQFSGKKFSDLSAEELHILSQRLKVLIEDQFDDMAYSEQFNRVMENNAAPPFYTNLAYQNLKDMSMLAKFLNFDAILDPHDNRQKAQTQAVGHSVCMDAFYLINNPGVLLVCGEEAKRPEK